MTTNRGAVPIDTFRLTGQLAATRRLLLAVLAFACLCSTAVAADWELVYYSYEPGDPVHYIDTESIVPIERNGFLYWVKIT